MRLDDQPRFRLARLPTPLHDARRLREALGGPDRCPRILFKRDDLTDLALGGNKARKLEFLIGDARRKGAKALITTGGAQSNHARMTAAAAAIAGMKAALVLTTDEDSPATQGNLLLDRLLGAEVHFVLGKESKSGAAAEAEAQRVIELMARFEGEGLTPYFIELGGSSAVGALGYVDASRELTRQLLEPGYEPSRLYYASGSRGTQAGLELGALLFGASYRPIGIAVSGGEPEKRDHAVRVAREAAELLGVTAPIDPDQTVTDQSYIGEGYGIPTAACIEAIRITARAEGILLDPVYTGKAMAGMIDHIRKGRIDPAETIVFLHTGGAPGFFAKADRVLSLLGEG
ncbi:MAG: D-cysteine desulfhydrase family protein [Gemmatimonadota bacterium]|jgi:D-cysteine desulfhydrase family pyridoxal phosphate-dependent enzyme